jgi:hypothetical protein
MLSIARAPCRTEQKGCSAKARHAVLRDQQHLSVSCPLHDRSHSFVELVHRIGSKPPDDLVRKAWRRRLECQVTFTAPFHDLDPVQARV